MYVYIYIQEGGVVIYCNVYDLCWDEDKEDKTGAKKKKVIRLDAITVEGRIQKPQAFYILQRSTLNFDELNRAESFVPKVEKSVEKEAF
jgi:hypothetical protein